MDNAGSEAVLIGFTTYHGTVTAASEWAAHAERKRVHPALPNSYEALFHDTDVLRFLLPLRHGAATAAGLHEPRLERAIGVIYRPESKRASHYFRARLAKQFDAVRLCTCTLRINTPGSPVGSVRHS